MFEYGADVVRVVDGDTVYLNVDLGFFIRVTIQVRLRGVNTPELRGLTRERGLAAKAYVEAALPTGAKVVVHTYKLEKYGRYLADLYYSPGADSREAVLRQPHHLNQELLDRGLAAVYMADEIKLVGTPRALLTEAAQPA
ncbi:MAG TPA: thermonuclease family protein [Longimicrobiaceae bacterium]|nr:thermonuclease family protein [Longimicrobiaceae bacterium]